MGTSKQKPAFPHRLKHSSIDAVQAELRGGPRADDTDLQLVALRAAAAGVELSPYMISLLGERVHECCKPAARSLEVYRYAMECAAVMGLGLGLTMLMAESES